MGKVSIVAGELWASPSRVAKDSFNFIIYKADNDDMHPTEHRARIKFLKSASELPAFVLCAAGGEAKAYGGQRNVSKVTQVIKWCWLLS